MYERLRLALPVVVVVVLGGIAIYAFKPGGWGRRSGGSSGSPGAPAASSSGASPLSAASGEATTSGPADGSAATAPASGASIPALEMKQFSDGQVLTLLNLPPQQQAEQMMMAAVNHYDGATKMVMEHVAGWRGQLKKTQNWDTVELEARYSSDLRVRDAAIEVDLTLYQLEKDSATVDRILTDAQAHVSNRGWDLTMLGMLANRGADGSRVHAALRDWAHDPDEGTRYWAIEGLAYIGTDDTIDDFLDVLRHDPSLNVRQRCGASLAKSGMLTRVQRMKAVPGLMDIAEDRSQDANTRGWAFRALREITAEPIGEDAPAWRAWFSAHGRERVEQFREGDPNAVLGNS